MKNLRLAYVIASATLAVIGGCTGQTENGAATTLSSGPNPNTVYSAAWSPNGKSLAAGFGDGSVKIFSVADENQPRLYEGNSKQTQYLAFSPDGNWLASACSDAHIKVWDVHTSSLVKLIPTRFVSPQLAFSHDSKLLVGVVDASAVTMWNTATWLEAGSLPRHADGTDGMVNCLVLASDGKTLVVAYSDGTVAIWDISTRRSLRAFKIAKLNVCQSLAVSPDCNVFVTSGDDGKLTAYDMKTGVKVKELLDSTDSTFHSMAFSPNGKALIEVGQKLRIWDANTWDRQRVVNEPGFLANPPFDSAGRRCAVFAGSKVYVLDTSTWKEVMSLPSEHIVVETATDQQRVTVGKDYTWTRGDGYDYVRGSVQNNSSRPVSYWKVTASFFDKQGHIGDSEFTNSGEMLRPGAAKRFEIMHRANPSDTKVSAVVGEVRFAD